MSLIIDNVEVEEIIYNGINLDKFYYDNVLVFEKNKMIFLDNFKIPTTAQTFRIVKEGDDE